MIAPGERARRSPLLCSGVPDQKNLHAIPV
jgi:hypothetical protein